VTDPRLHSTKPIDDEVPFEDADEIRRDEAPQEADALVTPAAAERQRIMPDRDVEPSARQTDDLVEDEGDAS
jgi:hypothetical protein